MSNCKKCGKPLSKSIYSKDGALKSCPSCSQSNGKYHVFHEYPDAYGTTPLRKSGPHSDGPQSHCTVCRSNKGPAPGIECKDVELKE